MRRGSARAWPPHSRHSAAVMAATAIEPGLLAVVPDKRHLLRALRAVDEIIESVAVQVEHREGRPLAGAEPGRLLQVEVGGESQLPARRRQDDVDLAASAPPPRS